MRDLAEFLEGGDTGHSMLREEAFQALHVLVEVRVCLRAAFGHHVCCATGSPLVDFWYGKPCLHQLLQRAVEIVLGQEVVEGVRGHGASPVELLRVVGVLC